MIRYDWTLNEPYEVPEFRPMLKQRLHRVMERSREMTQKRSDETALFLRSGIPGAVWDTFLLFTAVAGILLGLWLLK